MRVAMTALLEVESRPPHQLHVASRGLSHGGGTWARTRESGGTAGESGGGGGERRGQAT